MDNIYKCKELVITIYNNMDASHDYQHIERVYKNAETILQSEPQADALNCSISGFIARCK